jgi:hypothetical protein
LEFTATCNGVCEKESKESAGKWEIQNKKYCTHLQDFQLFVDSLSVTCPQRSLMLTSA